MPAFSNYASEWCGAVTPSISQQQYCGRPSGKVRAMFRAMFDECANKPAPKPPRCPKCAQVMRLVRRTPRFDGLPELFTFECLACGVFHFEV
jgi:hypothetical protein